MSIPGSSELRPPLESDESSFTPGPSEPSDLSSARADVQKVESKVEKQQPAPGTHEWELLSLSQANPAHSVSEGTDVSAPLAAPSRSVISLGGIGTSLVDSAHFSAPDFRQLHPDSTFSAANLSLESSATETDGSGSRALPKLSDSITDLEQTLSVSSGNLSGTGAPMFVMWQREFQPPVSSSIPTFLTVSTAGILSGAHPNSNPNLNPNLNVSNLRTSEPNVLVDSRSGLPFSPDFLFTSLQQSNRATLLDSKTCDVDIGGNEQTGQALNATSTAFHRTENRPAQGVVDLDTYLDESFGKDSWQVTLPVQFSSNSSSSSGLDLHSSSLPPSNVVSGPLSVIQQVERASEIGKDHEKQLEKEVVSRSWTLVQPTDASESDNNRPSVVQQMSRPFPSASQNLPRPVGDESPEDEFSSFDSEESLGSESGPDGNRGTRDSTRDNNNSNRVSEASGDRLGISRRSSSEESQERESEGDNHATPDSARAASNDRTVSEGARTPPQRSSWLSLGETWWSERGGIVRRIWAGLEDQQGAFWATALTAAVVGLVLLAQRLQLERRRNEHLHSLLKKRDDTITQLKAQMVRLTEAMSRQHRVPVIRTSASFPRLSSLG